MAISVPVEQVKSTLTNVEKKFLHNVRVPGFRLGKTPSNLVKKRFLNKIQEEVKNELIKAGLETAIHRSDPQPVTLPTFLKGEAVELKENDEFKFTVEFDVAPKFDLPEYKGIKLSYSPQDVKEENIDKVVEDLRKERLSYDKVDRASEENDMLMVSYKADGVNLDEVPDNVRKLVNNDETWFLLCEPEVIPGITEGLKGLSAGDKTPILVNYPPDYRENFLAGKTLNYEFTIHEVHMPILPELDSEFSKQYGMSTMEELKSSIRDKLNAELESHKKMALRKQLFDFLQKHADFSLPPVVLEAEKQQVKYMVAEDWIKKGRSSEQIKEDKDEFLRQVEETATERLKLQYIITEIAKNERIEVGDGEVEKYLAVMESQLARNPKPNSKKPDRETLKSNVKWNLLMERVAEKLIEHADITVKES